MDKDKRIKQLESALCMIADIDLTFVDENKNLRKASAEEKLAKIHKIAHPFSEEHYEAELY